MSAQISRFDPAIVHRLKTALERSGVHVSYEAALQALEAALDRGELRAQRAEEDRAIAALGADLAAALLLRLTGESPFGLRTAMLVFFLAGMLCYWRFCAILLNRAALSGSGFAIALIGPFTMFQIAERSVYFLFPLLAFAPYVVLDLYYRTKRMPFLWAARKARITKAPFVCCGGPRNAERPGLRARFRGCRMFNLR